MGSKRAADVSSDEEAPDSAKVRLRVENLLGQRTELLAPVWSTVRAVKEVLASLHGLNIDRQSLVRCGTGDGKDRYTRLEDHKTLQESGVENDDRLFLVPVLRSGPLSEESRNVKIFIENDKMTGTIDRLLKECGKTRKADCHYVLAQMDSQKPGEFTILEIPLGRSLSESSNHSDQGKHPPQRVLTPAERKQNLKTYSKMKKLRENIERRKTRKKLPTSPVAKVETPCGSCGALTTNSACRRCDQVYCPKHAKRHPCSYQWCRQQ